MGARRGPCILDAVRWRWFSTSDLPPLAVRMRRTHERWLTRALAAEVPLPRIPARLVSEGGFARELASPAGRRWILRWWEDTLDDPALADD